MNESPQGSESPTPQAFSATPPQGTPVPPPPAYQVPPQQTYVPPQQPQGGGNFKTREQGIGSASKEKWPAAVLAFVLGALGIHKFYLGYKSEGLVMLLVSLIGGLCTFGLATCVMGVIGLIEAVKYVTLTEDDFQATYVQGYKGWF